MSVSYGKGDRGKATMLHSLIVRSRGHCQAYGEYGAACNGALECAHIMRRDYGLTRTDLRNALCLCKGHHQRFTRDPFGWVDFCRTLIGTDEVDQLRTKAESNDGTLSRAWWADELERLRHVAVDAGIEDEARRRGLILKAWAYNDMSGG